MVPWAVVVFIVVLGIAFTLCRKWSEGSALDAGRTLPAIAGIALAGVLLACPAIAGARREPVMVYCVSSEQPALTFTARSKPTSCLLHHAGEGNFEDAYTYVTKMRWSDWGAPSAHGAGTFLGNMQFRASAQVTLSRLRSCSGREVYTHFAITISGDGSYAMPIEGCPSKQTNKSIHRGRSSTTSKKLQTYDSTAATVKRANRRRVGKRPGDHIRDCPEVYEVNPPAPTITFSHIVARGVSCHEVRSLILRYISDRMPAYAGQWHCVYHTQHTSYREMLESGREALEAGRCTKGAAYFRFTQESE